MVQMNRPHGKFHIKRKYLIWVSRALLILLAAAGVFCLIVAGTVLVLRIGGKSHLYAGQEEKLSSMRDAMQAQALDSNAGKGQTQLEEDEEEWQEGWIRYQDKVYAYNEDILTFLFLGIDKMGKVQDAKSGIDGGQSDAIFLMVLNPHTKEISVIGINRDTMTEIDIYDKKGNYVSTSVKQLTLQHGYGDGREQSCERSKEAVSKLFYGLPIHGYCAINMGAIPILNDTIGGVEVTSLEDLNGKKQSPPFDFKNGQSYLLKGMDAYWYVKYRDTTLFNSAGLRLERQKQYLNAYIAKAKQNLKKDLTLPITLYKTLSPYMITDVTVDEVSYLATESLQYSFSLDNIYSLEGETVQGERFEEFHPDKQALYELILSVFYEELP